MQELTPKRLGGGTGCRALILVLTIPLTAAALVLGVILMSRAEGSLTPASMALFGLAFAIDALAVVGFLFIAPAIDKRLLTMKLGQPTLSLPQPIHVGQRFRVTYSQRAERATEVEQINVRLILREWVRWQQGTDTSTDTHEYLITEETRPGRSFQPGSSILEAFELRIPSDSMHTLAETYPLLNDPAQAAEFQAALRVSPPMMQKIMTNLATETTPINDDNTLTWLIRTEVKVKGWLDSVNEWEFEVSARIAEGVR